MDEKQKSKSILLIHYKKPKKIYTRSLMTHAFMHVIVCTEENRAGNAGSERYRARAAGASSSRTVHEMDIWDQV